MHYDKGKKCPHSEKSYEGFGKKTCNIILYLQKECSSTKGIDQFSNLHTHNFQNVICKRRGDLLITQSSVKNEKFSTPSGA